MPIIITALSISSVNIWLYQAMSYLWSKKSITVAKGKKYIKSPPANFYLRLEAQKCFKEFLSKTSRFCINCILGLLQWIPTSFRSEV